MISIIYFDFPTIYKIFTHNTINKTEHCLGNVSTLTKKIKLKINEKFYYLKLFFYVLKIL